MIISHRHKFIFFANGKTASTSISYALAGYHEGALQSTKVPGLFPPTHMPPHVLRAVVPSEVWDGYFKFCFVRNPWDWFVSQYFWNALPEIVPKNLKRPSGVLRALAKHRLQFFSKAAESRRVAKALRNTRKLSPADVLKTYDVLKNYRAVPDAESLFQVNYAFVDGVCAMDYIGRFEHLEDDFHEVVSRLDLDARLDTHNRNDLKQRDYRGYYDDETYKLVKELYAIDIETFGYTFEKTPDRSTLDALCTRSDLSSLSHNIP